MIYGFRVPWWYVFPCHPNTVGQIRWQQFMQNYPVGGGINRLPSHFFQTRMIIFAAPVRSTYRFMYTPDVSLVKSTLKCQPNPKLTLTYAFAKK